MNVTKCSNGHFYDADKYSSCPHCGATAGNSAQKTTGTSGRNAANNNGSSFVEVKPMPEKTMGKTFGVFDEPKSVREAKPEVKSEPSVTYKAPESGRKCPACGKLIPESAKFCRYCGSRIEAVVQKKEVSVPENICPSCGKSCPEGALFCRYCGSKLEVTAPETDNVRVETINEAAAAEPAADYTQESFQNNVNIAEEDTGVTEISQPEYEENIAQEETVSLHDAVRNAVSGAEGKTIGFFSMGTSEQKAGDPVVGWLVAIKGKHFGESFNISAGRNSIGRGISNNIIIANDNAVSREKQLWLVYEPKKREFFVQPGEGSGLSYLNGDIIMETKKINAKDKLEIGEGAYILIPLCDESFSWEDYIK